MGQFFIFYKKTYERIRLQTQSLTRGRKPN
nr:MAG TPA: hypothetical protein [Caudoviricetes sp.]